ncbi:MAG: hypothetical protein DDT19_02989 [Syntrophomonadaceae bacterium]|nr:hypothetical protein [Bacillota bacterium]
MKLIKSSYLRVILDSAEEHGFVFHTLFGNSRIINVEGLRFLSLFNKPISVSEVVSLCDGDWETLAREFTSIFFLVEDDFDEMELLKQKQAEHLERIKNKSIVDHINLSVSNRCNFGCSHCMFLQFPGEKQTATPNAITLSKMEWETAKMCVDAYIKILRETGRNSGRIHFGDAEPLLNWTVIKMVLEYTSSSLLGFSFEYAINTNLSLLNREMALTLKKYNVKVATSLDGIGSINDLIRVTAGTRKGTFEKIIQKLDLLAGIGYPVDGISVTVTDANFPFVGKEIIDFAYERGMNSIAFDYDLINRMHVSIEERVDKIMELRAYANGLDIYFGGTWGAPFRKLMLGSILDKPHGFCAAVEGSGLAFDIDGSIKVCDYSMTRIGHLKDINDLFIESGGLYQLVKIRFPGNDERCKGCILEVVCGGQCHITREVAAKGSEEIFSEMCDFYRAMTLALIRDTLIHYRERR